MSDAARRAEGHGESRLLEELQPPWPTFFDDVKTTVERISVSYKPDHSLSGGLHNETIYGLAGAPDAKGRPLVVHRVPLENVAKRSDLDDVADPILRAQLLTATEGADGALFKTALSMFSKRTGIRRVRLLERLSVRAIANPGRIKPNLVKTDGNYCYEIIRDIEGKWRGYAVSLFEANRVKELSRITGIRGDPLVMRLHVNDLITVGNGGQRRLYRVAQITDAFLTLAEHFEAGKLRARHAEVTDGFRYLFLGPSSLKELGARISPVDELGYVNDPGFRE
jgi:CRISPR-associated endonuclease Csn1